jgi:hypothetical protein
MVTWEEEAQSQDGMHYLQVSRLLINSSTPPLRLLPSPALALDTDPPRYRIRKVKCDEVKPSCNRCTHTGRKCDGYAPPTSNAPKKSSLLVRSPKQALHQSDVHVDVVLSSIFGTPEEHWSLDFFIRRTAPAISGAFDTGFVCVPLEWGRLRSCRCICQLYHANLRTMSSQPTSSSNRARLTFETFSGPTSCHN